MMGYARLKMVHLVHYQVLLTHATPIKYKSTKDSGLDIYAQLFLYLYIFF